MDDREGALGQKSMKQKVVTLQRKAIQGNITARPVLRFWNASRQSDTESHNGMKDALKVQNEAIAVLV